MSVDPANMVMELTDEAMELVLLSEIAPGDLIAACNDGSTRQVQVWRGFDDGELHLPYIDISSYEADPREQVANFEVHVAIELRTHHDDVSRAEHRRLAGLIGAVLWRESDDGRMLVLADLLNNVGVDGYSAMFWTPGKTSRTVEEQERVTRFEGVVFARCSD